MSRSPNYMYRVSERLSEVFDDIGVNERLVRKRRRAMMLQECIDYLKFPFNRYTTHIFGSQSEGSTTLGLGSDIDSLICFNEYNVIQSLREWKQGSFNLMMIQNDNISPGYCYLQCFQHDKPLPATYKDFNLSESKRKLCLQDYEEGCLIKNTVVTSQKYNRRSQEYNRRFKTKLNGPAFTVQGDWFMTSDFVMSFYGKSIPHQVTSWLKKQRKDKCLPENLLEACRNAGCFVVAVSSKGSDTPELEWRISTSLQERYLMFSLNISELICYILMKMTLKTYINPYVEDVLTSFMCKNVLMYCVANSSHDWHTGNLLSYLHLCLFMLKECIKQRNCPHFIIPENNLLTGRMTDILRDKLLNIIDNLLNNYEQLLFNIEVDDLGRRLKIKLNMITTHIRNIESASHISQVISYGLVLALASTKNNYLELFLDINKHQNSEMALQTTSRSLSFLERHRKQGNEDLKTASELLIPLLSSTFGSILATTNINTLTAVSKQALTYLKAGKESDALSGRLKLASVLYRTGDMERAECELRIIQTRYNNSPAVSVCRCKEKEPLSENKSLMVVCDAYNEEAIKSNIAFCTKFLQCEMDCVPYELRYEILRSYLKEDIQLRTWRDTQWMDLIVVDSIPYLYFLQYKTYGHLQKREEQEQALENLLEIIINEPGLGHTETALNLLGQCWEQENQQITAVECYIVSLWHRMRNNAARWLLCLQLFKLWKKYNTQ